MKKHSNEGAYYQRLRDLADIPKNKINEEKAHGLGTLIDFKRGADNVAYGIVKENHQYYIKKSNKQADPNAEDFAYIGGLENITEYQYKSLAEADKNRNMFLATINEALGEKKTSVSKKQTNDKKVITENVDENAEEDIEKSAEAAAELDAAAEKETTPEEPKVDVDVETTPEEPEVGAEVSPEGGEETPKEPKVDVDVETSPEGGEETPEEPSPEGDKGDDIDVDAVINGDEDGEETPEGDEEATDESNREIQKLVGKIGNKVRNTQMTPSQTQSYLNSLITSFEEKLPELEVEERKEMANKLMKVVDGEEELENMEDTENNDEIGETKSCDECGFAKYVSERGYDADSIMECGIDEMANLMSGYIMDKDDEIGDDDYEDMAVFSSPEIEKTLQEEYGHSEIGESFKPFTEKMNEENANPEAKKEKVKGMFWWEIEPQKIGDSKKKLTEDEEEEMDQTEVPSEEDIESDENGDEEINSAEEFKEYANTVLKKAHGEDFDPEKAEYMIKGLTNMVKASEEEDWGSAVGILQQSLDETFNGRDPAAIDVQPNMTEKLEGESDEEAPEEDTIDTEAPEEDVFDTEAPEEDVFDLTKHEKPEMDMTQGFETMGADVVKPEGAEAKSVDVEVNKDSGTVNVSMNESEQKIRKYIRTRLEEKAGLRKPALNEDKKSKKIKQLDKMIDEQYKLFETIMDEEGIGKAISGAMGKAAQWLEGDLKLKKKLKEQLPNIDSSDTQAINSLFYQTFRSKMDGALEKFAKRATPEKKYEILQQALQDKGGLGKLKLKGQEIVYLPTKHDEPSKATDIARGRSRLGM